MLTIYDKIVSESALISVDAAEAILRLSDLREAIEKVYPGLYEPGDGDQIRQLISQVRSAVASMAERTEKLTREVIDSK